jgi:hypothetical protein
VINGQEIYVLSNVYELHVPCGPNFFSVRVEIFTHLTELKRRKARVWLLRLFNLYPSDLNSTDEGLTTNSIHSMESINSDITYMLESAEEWAVHGKPIDELDLLKDVIADVQSFLATGN